MSHFEFSRQKWKNDDFRTLWNPDFVSVEKKNLLKVMVENISFAKPSKVQWHRFGAKSLDFVTLDDYCNSSFSKAFLFDCAECKASNRLRSIYGKNTCKKNSLPFRLSWQDQNQIGSFIFDFPLPFIYNGSYLPILQQSGTIKL